MKTSSGSTAVVTLGLALGLFTGGAGCGGPESFHLLGNNGTGLSGSGGGFGSGGVTPFPSGGAIGSGGFIGSGGRVNSGGAIGSGGASSSGGQGAGGGLASGGRAATGGSVGSGGASSSGGRSGTGGGAGGGNCLTTVQAAGYSSGSAMCSSCRDNSTPLADKCMAMVDCMASQWPCSGNCETNCLNMVAGSGIVANCVDALVTAACN